MFVTFRYKGWFLFCPVYISEIKPGSFIVYDRGCIPWLLSFASFIRRSVIRPVGAFISKVLNIKFSIKTIWGVKPLKQPIEFDLY